MASEVETPVVQAEAPASATATAAEPTVPAPVVESHAQAPVEADFEAGESAAQEEAPAAPAVVDPAQAHIQAPVEADPEGGEFDDADSALGSEAGSATTSLSSGILKYREENGRTYHAYKDGKYLFPNDERENDRLDLQHHMWMLTLDGKLYLAPLPKTIGRVLDVGTGTGIWAIDFADEHPEAQVLGVDLSPIQPAFIPPNLTFEIDDLEADWTFNTKFSYIHTRIMSGSFSDWPRFLEQSMENLEPGGYLELQEFAPIRCDDGTFPETCDFYKWGQLITQASIAIGRPLNILYELKAMVEAAGFEDVVQQQFMWPENTWPRDKKLKEIGQWTLANIDGGLEDISMALFTRVLGWTKQEVEAYLPGVRRNVRDRSMHTYMPIYVIYGRKPLAT